MKLKIFFSLSILLLIGHVFLQPGFAHDLNYTKEIKHQWTEQNGNHYEGSFYLLKEGTVYIETSTNQFHNISLKSLSKADQQYVLNRQAKIDALNRNMRTSSSSLNLETSTKRSKTIILLLIALLGITFLYTQRRKTHFKSLLTIYSAGLFFTLVSAGIKSAQSTNPSTINNAFAPFVPNVHTFYDSTYFWVESQGIPTTHPMMVGISSNGWQRQVPIPQCYMGTNAWPIPLNPVMASNPIPVDSIHFTRGAIAIAVNGVPIFNEHTNTGADALTAGQLDTYGGHCGRGDDYHYHIAPLHLYNYTSATLPIAYALDGFAVYGAKEADGTNMQTLDANHGHSYGGTYHYHGTSTYPYMIARMAGQVTEDATHQLIPQAVAHPVRPGQLPLNGALITACTPNTMNNGYNLTYTYKGNTDSVVYNWDAAGNYTFNYYTAANLDSTETKHGFVQCIVPATPLGINSVNQFDHFKIYPNPASDKLFIESNTNIQQIEVYSSNGVLEFYKSFENNSNQARLSIAGYNCGLHFIRIVDQSGKASTQKFVKE